MENFDLRLLIMQNSDFEGALSGCHPVVIHGIQIKDEKTDKSFWQYIEDTQKLELLRERQVIDLASKVIGLKSENESYLRKLIFSRSNCCSGHHTK
ncbi:unnamed protein product [Rhizophagus irregularis]|nr:unnamed protein product [Rhizophagus irregularis]